MDTIALDWASPRNRYLTHPLPPTDANDLLEHARGSLCDTQYEDLEIQRAFQEAINGVQQAVAAAKSVARNALERAEVGIDGTMAAEEAATPDKLEMVWKPPSDAACSMPTMEKAGADDVAALEGPVLEQEPSDLHAEVFSKPQPKFHGYDVPLTAPGTRSKESENDLVCLWT